MTTVTTTVTAAAAATATTTATTTATVIIVILENHRDIYMSHKRCMSCCLFVFVTRF